MNIVIVHNSKIPALLYGGTERVIWYLGKELIALGHRVSYLVKKGSYADFACVQFINPEKNIASQLPPDTDMVHFHYDPGSDEKYNFPFPYIITMHGNTNAPVLLDINTVFVSKNHASRYGAESYVHNGMGWDDYTLPTFSKENYFHFLGKAAWRIKNVKGAIELVKNTKYGRIKVLGGSRLNFNMGFRFTLTPRAVFCGMVGGTQKHNLLDKSAGLVFPVLWHEPFGLAVIESLYYGCPVFATPYGSLIELVNEEVGFLSRSSSELTQALENAASFSHQKCHDYARENFNAKKMAIRYVEKYESVLNGHTLNSSPPKLKQVQAQKFLDWVAH